MATQGYDAVSMRSLAKALDTGPASLYQHVANRDELDQLVIDRIASQLHIPEADPDGWVDQLKDVFREMRDLYRAHPGAARAAMAQIPTREGDLAGRRGHHGALPRRRHLAAGRRVVLRPRRALRERDRLRGVAVGPARELHEARRGARPRSSSTRDMVAFFENLPPDVFPLMSRYINEMTNGDGDERFEFGLDVLISGLAAVSEKYR